MITVTKTAEEKFKVEKKQCFVKQGEWTPTRAKGGMSKAKDEM
jgi:hypothetical protein